MTATVPPVALDPGMARKLRAAAARASKATDERDALMAEAQDAGVSLRDIGDAVGLSHTGVAKVLKRWRART